MNKLTLPLAFCALALSIFTLFSHFQKSELAYVDINKLVEGYERTKVERMEFNKKAETLKANVDSLMTGWETDLKSYEKERLSMSKKEIQLKQELLKNKQQQISNYQKAVQNQLKEEDQRLTQTVINDINDYLQEYGKQEGYRIILGAKGDGNLMYAEEASDLTEIILEDLNNSYKTL
ncbi:MAG: OmpH family outer membrane protein [Bacteroidota bacterium]